ncbi:phage terminase small subunit [Ostreibacterium oceani]|uniref:Terminase n=1 Tax=Ostreibacterium oceani TaxID=2654998 RepID=A0A6N7EZG5_9GAMM|nr:phage terminase small subunit [Ostreibacterium oceani]MPV86915.1 hypothetical protein [Ostreibacterium oceani]
MSSLFRRHRERILAAQHAEADRAARAGGTSWHTAVDAYDTLLMALAEDNARLSNVRGTEAKTALKRELLPTYRDWSDAAVDAILSSDMASDGGSENSGENNGGHRQDDIVAHVFVWSIDIGDYDTALRLFSAISAADMTLPERFRRRPADFLAEQLAEAAIDECYREVAPDARTVTRALFDRVMTAIAGIDMHDEISAKLMKAGGGLSESDDDLSGALDYYERAIALNPKIGVKTKIKALKKALKKAADDSRQPDK